MERLVPVPDSEFDKIFALRWESEPTDEDIMQLAAWLEGEGCFDPASEHTPSVQAQCTDRDVIEWAADILGTSVKGPYNYKGKQNQYRVQVFGGPAIYWMMRLLPYMKSQRRTSTMIEQILTFAPRYRWTPQS